MKKLFTLPAAFWIVGCVPAKGDVRLLDVRCDNPSSGLAAIRAHLILEY